MRVAVIVVLMTVVATPSQASKSCMSKTEARAAFRTAHLYWHGPDHCWDATPTRRHQVQVRRIQKESVRRVQRQEDPPKWRDAMSRMLAEEDPVQTPTARTTEDYQGGGAGPAGAVWSDRWVDVAQVVSPDLVEPKPVPIVKSEPAVTPRNVILIFFAFAMTFVIIEVLFRNGERRS
jgi:hypothetical protein